MRLFTALDLPYEMRRNLELLLHLLKPQARLAWSSVANLHLTTKFIGDFPEERLDSLKATLAGIPQTGALRIALRGLGYFPDARHPRVFYVGIHAPDALAELARDRRRLRRAGHQCGDEALSPASDAGAHPRA
jgi:2'-5' RNA ligase